MAVPTVLSLLVLACVPVSIECACFNGGGHSHDGCDPHNFDYSACQQTDPNSWNCHDNQYCSFQTDHNGHVSHLDCKGIGELEACRALQAQNDPSCDPRNLHVHQDCVYCCEDFQCFASLDDPNVRTATTPEPAPVPADHSCYDTPCHHGDDLATCSQGQWACSSDQFCSLHIDHGIDMKCEDVHKWQGCLDHNAENIPLCDMKGSDISVQANCKFCCQNDQCVQNLLSPPSSTTSLPVSSPTAIRHCFTSPCRPGESLATCTSGVWACGANEFCDIDIMYDMNTAIFVCTKQEFDNFEACYQRRDQYSCTTAADVMNNHLCHFCCPDSGCASNITSLIKAADTVAAQGNALVAAATTTAATATATAAATATTSPPITTPTTTAAQDCQDLYQGNCATDYAGQCHELLVGVLCPRTCHKC